MNTEITINGEAYVKVASLPKPAAPAYHDADGREVQVGSSVRVRLSKLANHKMDEDNRHGTIVQAEVNSFGVEFPHRLCNASFGNGYGRYFLANEIRRN